MKPRKQIGVRALLSSFSAACVTLAFAAPASSQPLFGGALSSIESTIANADRVVVGKIAVVGDGKAMGRSGAIEVEFAVEETLKGEHHPLAALALPQAAPVLAAWKVQSHRLLVAVDEDRPAPPTVIDLDAGNLGVLTADFRLLRRSEQVIRTARKAVRRWPGVRRMEGFELVVPQAVVAGTDWERYYRTGGHVRVSVPVDERLERRARAFLRSGNYLRRKEGARALRHFKSPENIARVKALLRDRGWAYLHRAGENQGVEVRVYGVREEAHRTLKYWGVNVPEPVVRRESRELARVRTVDLSNTQVSREDLQALARFENLQNLFLRNTPLTDAHLSQLAALSNLRELYLSGTRITGDGLKHLAGLPHLRYLDLGGTHLADEDLHLLAALKPLKQVDLGGSRVTAAGVAALRKLRPDLQVER